MIQLEQVIKNRYRIVQRIGQGGFGETFEVDDRGKPKVIKILNTFTDHEKQQKALSLFQREAEVLRKLNHAGIPKVEPDGYFTWQDGIDNRHCLVMEKIDGQTLQKWLEDNRDKITEQLAIDWLKQLLSILEYVHQHGYIHRDINPSNIIVKPNGELVLIDFGCAREISSTYLAKLVDDVKGTQLFTPGYTPREQIEGKPVPQSDFFALGRTFVELLTGISPKQLPEDNLTGHLIWHDRAATVSQQLADLIDRMMAVFLSDRPHSTRVIGQQLANLEKTREKIPQVIYRRNILKLGVAGLVSAVAIAFPFASPEIAVFCNDQGLENYIINRFFLAEVYYKCATVLKSDYAKPRYNLGALYESQKKFDLAVKEYQKAIALRPNFAAAYNNLARLKIMQYQKYREATLLLQKALELPQSDETRYVLHKNLGWTLLKQGRYSEAKVYLETAINLNPERAVAHCVLAKLLEKEGGNSKAEWEKCERYASNDSSAEVDAWITFR